MDSELIFDDKKFLSSRRAGDLAGYTNDYVARLARQGKVTGRKVGRTWYVEEDSFCDFLSINSLEKEKRMAELSQERKREYHDAVETTPAVFDDVDDEVEMLVPSAARASLFIKAGGLAFACLVLVIVSFSLAGLNPLSRVVPLDGSVAVEHGEAQENSASVLGSIADWFGGAWRAVRSLVVTTPRTISQNDTTLPDTSGDETSLPKDREGVVVVPSTLVGGSEEETKRDIQDAFSDEITIVPDPDGRTGVIKPVFRSSQSEDYLYVLVPVDEEHTE